MQWDIQLDTQPHVEQATVQDDTVACVAGYFKLVLQGTRKIINLKGEQPLSISFDTQSKMFR